MRLAERERGALEELRAVMSAMPDFIFRIEEMPAGVAPGDVYPVSDLALASRYSELVVDARLRRRIFGTIEAEWHRTVDALAAITGEKNRLAANPALARSIRHRFPYIDPLHHLQVELVRRYRAGESDAEKDGRVRRGIHISINGIAAGLRNTG